MTHFGRNRSDGRPASIGVRAATTSVLLLFASVAIAGAESRCDAGKLDAVRDRALCLAKRDGRADDAWSDRAGQPTCFDKQGRRCARAGAAICLDRRDSEHEGDGPDHADRQKCFDKFTKQCARAEALGDCTDAVKSCADLAADLGCPERRTFLIDVDTGSPILEVAVPGSAAGCASTELHFAVARDGTVDAQTCIRGRAGLECRETGLGDLIFRSPSAVVGADRIVLGAGDPTAGPVMPVAGPDDLLWLCREDDEGMQCICIPWAQD